MGSAPYLGLRRLLSQVVPGSMLREGLERILAAHMGALIVLGDQRDVLEICSGGFHIDAELSPQRLSELAKMDGAIVLDRGAERIAWANVHLVPDSSVSTNETGTRHRTAERVARCVDAPVVAVSEEMGTITLYVGTERRQLQSADLVATRATYLLQILGRLKVHFDESLLALRKAEAEQIATIRDMVTVVQRAEMVLRESDEIGGLLDELGQHASLLRPQLAQLATGVLDEQRDVIARLVAEVDLAKLRETSAHLRALQVDDLVVPGSVAALFFPSGQSVDLDALFI